jgi:general secretion pathway protein M
MKPLSAWLASREERERRVLFAGAAVVAMALLLGLVSLDHSVSRAQARLAQREQDLAWMRSVAPELAAAGPATESAPASPGSLIVTVDQAAHAAGLATSLTSSEPASGGGLRVRLDKAPFDTLVGWLQRLAEQHGIRVSSATIDDAGAPGLVNATLVLEAAH